MEINAAALEDVFNEIDSIGINAYFYAAFDDPKQATDIIFDALIQITNIHVYASYDHDFEVDDADQLHEIVHLNMANDLHGESLMALHSWIDDVVMNLAVGAISLDGFIEVSKGENLIDE